MNPELNLCFLANENLNHWPVTLQPLDGLKFRVAGFQMMPGVEVLDPVSVRNDTDDHPQHSSGSSEVVSSTHTHTTSFNEHDFHRRQELSFGVRAGNCSGFARALLEVTQTRSHILAQTQAHTGTHKYTG